jgi:hypothetical protein
LLLFQENAKDFVPVAIEVFPKKKLKTSAPPSSAHFEE